MSWDISILHQSLDTSVEVMMEKSYLGRAEEVIKHIQMVFPEINTLDPAWLRLDGGEYYIEFDLGNKPDVKYIMLHIHGNHTAMDVVRLLCESNGWAAYDHERKGFINLTNGEVESAPLLIEQCEEQKMPGIAPEQSSNKKKGWWGWAAGGAALLLGKFKTLLFSLFTILKFSKFLGTGLSMLVMIASYTFLYGWKYAIGIVMLLFIHEMGHVYFAHLKKLDVNLPVFIPFVGAFIRLKEEPKDAKTDAFVALGGPLFGVVAALGCLGLAFMYHSGLFAALAYFGFLITVFNLIPAYPLDGGRMVTSLSPVFWIIGIIIMGVVVVYYFNPIAILVLIMAVIRAWKAWKYHEEEKAYFEVDASFRWKMGVMYFGLFGISSFLVYWLHTMLRA